MEKHAGVYADANKLSKYREVKKVFNIIVGTSIKYLFISILVIFEEQFRESFFAIVTLNSF